MRGQPFNMVLLLAITLRYQLLQDRLDHTVSARCAFRLLCKRSWKEERTVDVIRRCHQLQPQATPLGGF